MYWAIQARAMRQLEYLGTKRKIHQFANGLKVYDDHLTSIQRERYKKTNVHEAEEEEPFTRLVQAIPEDGCIATIGAAFGYYAILAKLLVPGLTVCAVEPLERHRLFFSENVLLNGLSLNDFIVLKYGVASSDGMAVFMDAGYNSHVLQQGGRVKCSIKAFMKNLLLKVAMNGRGNASSVVTIKTITLDGLMQRIARSVDLVQMDVQGLESEVLRAGSSSLQRGEIKAFLVGTHGQEVHRKCIDILQMHRYNIAVDNDDPTDQPDGIIVACKETLEYSEVAQGKR